MIDQEKVSTKKYSNKIRPYLKDIMNNLKKSKKCKNQLTITINFIFSKGDNDDEPVTHSNSDNIEIMTDDKADEAIEELFKSRSIKIISKH